MAGEITSPTFTLINEYPGEKPFYHIDLYRILSTDELLFLGLEELFNNNGICVIEWSEKISPFLPEDTINISIRLGSAQTRYITIEGLNL